MQQQQLQQQVTYPNSGHTYTQFATPMAYPSALYQQMSLHPNLTRPSSIKIAVIFATNIVQVEVEKSSNFTDLIDFVSFFI